MKTRYLIVNADDFGLCHGVNQGVVRSVEHGIVTSASLMVRWPGASEAAAYARSHPRLSVGLHVDLAEWIYTGQEWQPAYEVVALSDQAAVEAEIRQQLDSFRRLVGRYPTHLDSHQHVHQSEPVRAVLVGIAERLQVPLRHVSDRVRYCGAFYGQTGKGEPYPEGITLDSLRAILAVLPSGYTEMACHPGLEIEVETTYRSERVQEVEVLCHQGARQAVKDAGIELRSFHDLAV